MKWIAITLTAMLLGTAVQAKSAAIVCITPRFEKAFLIENDKVSFFKYEDGANTRIRKVASIKETKTFSRGVALDKKLVHQGHNVHIRIKNVGEFSQLEDYIAMTNTKGHTMTYPLSCEFF